MRLIGTGVKIVIGISLIAVLIWLVGWQEIMSTVARLDPLIFIPIILLYLLILVMTGFSLWFFLREIGPLEMMRMSMVSWGLGTVTPAKIGHLSIVYFLNKEGVRLVRGGAAFVVDRAVGLFVSFVFFISGFLFFFQLRSFLLYMLIFFLLLLGSSFLAFHPLGKRLMRRFLIGNIADHVNGFTSEVRDIFHTRSFAIMMSFIFKVMLTLASAAVFWIIFSSLGVDVSIWMVAFVFSANTFINLIPITLDGLGVRESVAVLLYDQVGVGATAVVSTYLVVRFLNYLWTGLIILIFSDQLVRIKNDFPSIRRRA